MTLEHDQSYQIVKEMELLRQDVKYLIQLDNERRDHLRKDLREGQKNNEKQVAIIQDEIKRNRRIGKATILLGLLFAGMLFQTMSHGDLIGTIRLFIPFL